MAEKVGVEMVEVASNIEGKEEDVLGGDGFVVDGGRSPSTSSKDGVDGGVENKSSMGSRLITTGEGMRRSSWIDKATWPHTKSLRSFSNSLFALRHCEERKDKEVKVKKNGQRIVALGIEEDGQELCTI
ncbi:hypothetical protein Tco_0757038 [Tanacetum coccineum]